MRKTGPEWLRRVFTIALSLCLLALAGSAGAVGRVEWKTKTIKESDSHAWTIDVSIFLQKAPDVATLPMRFSFMPVVYYERSLLDGKEGPQLRKVPLEGKPPSVESVDVGFLDPGSGQIQKRTKFSFRLSRGNGYEAGEYDVTIKDGRSDAQVGTTVRVTLEGENEVIDRRAITFSGEKKKKDKDEGSESSSEEKPAKKELTEDDPGFWAGGPKDDQKEAEVEPKRGCGCRVGAENRVLDTRVAVLAGVAIAVAGLRRRRGGPRRAAA